MKLKNEESCTTLSEPHKEEQYIKKSNTCIHIYIDTIERSYSYLKYTHAHNIMAKPIQINTLMIWNIHGSIEKGLTYPHKTKLLLSFPYITSKNTHTSTI